MLTADQISIEFFLSLTHRVKISGTESLLSRISLDTILAFLIQSQFALTATQASENPIKFNTLFPKIENVR